MTSTVQLSLLSKEKPIHFIGIGGCGMNPIASTLQELGYTVSGSDLKPSSPSENLRKKGAHISYGHAASNIPPNTQLVAYSTAVPETNCERVQTKTLGLPEVERAVMLSAIMDLYEKKIAVTGTHGKTSTSSMLASIFSECENKPTFITGSDVLNLGTSYRLGTSDYFIAESDESDGSFLYMHANLAIISNIEPDHMEFFKTKACLRDYFKQFSDNVLNEPNGTLFMNMDDPESVDMYQTLCHEGKANQCITFAIKKPASYVAQHIEQTSQGISFDVLYQDDHIGRFAVPVFGMHNVYNALSAIALSCHQNLDINTIQKGLLAFKGTKRRFQLIGKERDISIFDDYGHHPTEILTTLQSIKNSFDQRLICIFQPHRYTRTRDMFDEFVDAFSPADQVVLADIYAAHEPPIDGISSKHLANAIQKKTGQSVRYIPAIKDIAKTLIPSLQSGDIVVSMGAGDIYTVANDLVAQLKNH